MDPLTPCLEAAVRVARAQGAKVVRRLPAAFLLAPEAQHVTYPMPEASCVGFLGVGRRHVQRLRLSIYDERGDLLSRSSDQRPYAYVSTCAVPGDKVVAHVQVLEGGGGVELLPMLDAPAKLPGLAQAMVACSGVGLPGPPPLDVGPPLPTRPLSERLAQYSNELKGRGYMPLGASMQGSLGSAKRDLRRLPLPAGHCLALAVIADDQLQEVDVRLLADGPRPVLLGRESGRNQPALLKVCTEEAAVFLIDVRSFGEQGRYLLQPYWLVPPKEQRNPIGLSPRMRSEFWELQWRLAGFGMAVYETQWVQLPSNDDYRAPLRLPGKRCYAVGLLGEEAQGERRDVDLCITDSQGNVMGNHSGPDPSPLIYLCPQRDGDYGALLRAPDAGGKPVRALLVVAGDQQIVPAAAPH